ncbi:MAG: DUF669 domain-containing protein [Eubacteriales bacterium]
MYDNDLMGTTEATENTDGMVFNLNDVEEAPNTFEVLPKGDYDAVIDELEFTESQSSGEPMMHATYTIVGGEYEGRVIHDYYMFGGKGAEYSLPRFKQLLVRVCPEVDLGSFAPGAFAESGVAIGRSCRLKLAVTTQKKGEYKGEKRNNVREIMSADSSSNSFLG